MLNQMVTQMMNSNMTKIVQAQGMSWARVLMPMAKFGVPLTIGGLWFVWPKAGPTIKEAIFGAPSEAAE